MFNYLVITDVGSIVSTQNEEETVETREPDRLTAVQVTKPKQAQSTSSLGLLQGRPTPAKTSKSIAIAPLSKSTVSNVTGSYVSLLSSNPEATTNQSNKEKTDLDEHDIDLEDPLAVWNHAMSLATNGKAKQAAEFFKIHEDLSVSKKMANEVVIHKPTPIITPPQLLNENKSSQVGEAFSEGGITFIPGAVTSHMDIGFTPYFDKNPRELKGPIPLTIFNRQWQDLANGYHVEKRVKIENLSKDITTYTGYPYPHEMTQSYSTWNTNYRNFVQTLRDVYHFKTFSEWAERHQENVEFYHTRDNWMTAFRYDIKIRLNAFAFRVSHNGNNAPPDISQKREDIAALCFAETRRLDEGSFEDNPYAKGGPKFGFDWTTGLPRSTNSHFANQNQNGLANYTSGSTDSQSNRASTSHSNENGKRPNRQSGGGGRPRGGYHGNNYNPNYAAKKQNQPKGNSAPATM